MKCLEIGDAIISLRIGIFLWVAIVDAVHFGGLQDDFGADLGFVIEPGSQGLAEANHNYAAPIYVLSVLTGFAVWKPIQFSWLAWMMGGFHYARIWHFAVMWAILFFVLGHLVMVVLHGWNNFVSMLTGWKKNPEY